MDVKKLTDAANFYWMSKEYLENEILLLNNPLLVNQKDFVFYRNELKNTIRTNHPSGYAKLLRVLDGTSKEEVYVLLTHANTAWRQSIEKLTQGICSFIPTAIEDITNILQQYGVEYGTWFDFILCFADVTKGADDLKNAPTTPKGSFVMLTYNGLVWFVSPRDGWVIHGDNPSKWEYIKDLTGHPFLSDSQLKEWT